MPRNIRGMMLYVEPMAPSLPITNPATHISSGPVMAFSLPPDRSTSC